MGDILLIRLFCPYTGLIRVLPIIDHERKHQKYLTSDFFSTGQGVMNTGLGPCSPAPVEVSAGGGAEVPGAGPHVAR